MGLMADWLKELPDRLIAERKRLFPTLTDAAKALGIKKQALSRREEARYKGAKIETLIATLEVLEHQTDIDSEASTLADGFSVDFLGKGLGKSKRKE
jgi:DNA-binding XRE family transcriptional regulator